VWSWDSSSSKLYNRYINCPMNQWTVVSPIIHNTVSKRWAIIFYMFSFWVARDLCNHKQCIICLNEIQHFLQTLRFILFFYINHVKLSIKRIQMFIRYITYSKLQLPLIQKAALLCFFNNHFCGSVWDSNK